MKRFKINSAADLYSLSKTELQEIITLLTEDLSSEVGGRGELTKNGILLDELIGKVNQVLVEKYND